MFPGACDWCFRVSPPQVQQPKTLGGFFFIFGVFRIRIHLIRIRIQNFMLNTDPDPGVWWPKKKITAKKINFILIKSYSLPLRLQKGRQSYRSLHPSKEKIQKHFKTWNFLIFFTFVGHFCPPASRSWYRIRIRIRIHWPDWIRIRIRNTALFE